MHLSDIPVIFFQLFNQQISIGSLCVSGFSINCDCCLRRRGRP